MKAVVMNPKKYLSKRDYWSAVVSVLVIVSTLANLVVLGFVSMSTGWRIANCALDVLAISVAIVALLRIAALAEYNFIYMAQDGRVDDTSSDEDEDE